MKIFCFFLLVLYCLPSFSQKKYHGVYRDSTLSLMYLDTAFNSMKEELASQGLPDAAIDKVMQQLKSQKFYSIIERRITGAGNSTVIKYDRYSFEGNLKLGEIPDSMLLAGGELYFPDSAGHGFSKMPLASPKKIFRTTGGNKIILSYSCKEYLSTDSTCRIWVAADLPSCINPGIRTGDIDGAVLAYELRNESLLFKSEIIDLYK